MDTFSIGYALLAVQSALLEVIVPELRAVVVDLSNETQILYIRFYYDGEVSEKLIDLWECAITEASADLGPDCGVDDGVERLDYPKEVPPRGRYAYLRKEPLLPSSDKLLAEIIPARPPSHKIEIFPVAYALLAVQRALIGKVTPQLRAIVVDVPKEKNLLYVHLYYDGEVGEEIIDLWESSVTEVSADLGLGYVLDVGVDRLDYPQRMPFRGRLAYLRKEGHFFIDESISD